MHTKVERFIDDIKKAIEKPNAGNYVTFPLNHRLDRMNVLTDRGKELLSCEGLLGYTQLEQSQANLAIAVEALSFYSDSSNWNQSMYTIISTGATRDCLNNDISDMDGWYSGGKLARQTLQKIKEKE